MTTRLLIRIKREISMKESNGLRKRKPMNPNLVKNLDKMRVGLDMDLGWAVTKTEIPPGRMMVKEN